MRTEILLLFLFFLFIVLLMVSRLIYLGRTDGKDNNIPGDRTPAGLPQTAEVTGLNEASGANEKTGSHPHREKRTEQRAPDFWSGLKIHKKKSRKRRFFSEFGSKKELRKAIIIDELLDRHNDFRHE